MRTATGWILLALSLVGPHANAADLVVLSAAATKGAMASLPDAFTDATHDHVQVIYGTAGFIRDKAALGTPFDLVILPPAPMADLIRRGLVIDGSMHSVGLVRLGAAVKSGTPHPSIATPEAFRDALLAATSIGLADPATGATSGIYLVKLLEQLGVMPQVKDRLKFYPEGQVAMEAAAHGEIALGLGQMSEILPVSGIDLLGTIPDSLQLKTTYAAGLSSNAHEPEAAQRLLYFLTGPSAVAAFKAQGFEKSAP